jgi:hypothetical protein
MTDTFQVILFHEHCHNYDEINDWKNHIYSWRAKEKPLHRLNNDRK